MRKFWSGILVGSRGAALVLAVVSVAVDPPVAAVTAPDAAAKSSPAAGTTQPEPSTPEPATAEDAAEPEAKPDMADEAKDTETESPSAKVTGETATEEKPSEAASPEELSTEEMPSEQVSSQDMSTEETPAEETPTAETPAAASTDADRDASGETTPATEEDPATTAAAEAEPDKADPKAADPETAEPDAPAAPETQEDANASAPVPDVATEAPEATKVEDETDARRPEAASVTNAPDPVAPIKPVDGAVVVASMPAADTGRPPLERYAEPFRNPDEKPKMSIVLIDDAESAGSDTLAGFPYPVTFAVDPALQDAEERMARHRANGFEVVALMDLPGGTTPGNLDTALMETFQAVPEAVALLETPGGDIQADRAMSDAVTKAMAETGRGLILQPDGRDTAQKLAAQAGVASGVVFRDLAGAGQTSDVMRRFLDQAANRAVQRDDVIVMARMRPETVSALVIWGLQDRVNQVALAPVSHLLSDQPGE